MCRIILLSLSLLLWSGAVQGFVVPQSQQHQQPNHYYLSILNAKKSKGFGAKEPPATAPKKRKAPPSSEPTSTTSSNRSSAITSDPADVAMMSSTRPEDSNPFPEQSTDTSQGKAMLERMRRERAEQRNEQLRKVKEVQDVDAMLRDSPDAAAIPERVAQRMGARMLPFVGIPLFGGMGAFVGFWYMATYRDTEFEPALVAAATIVLLVTGLVGITYSIMSSSWDPDREGTLVGLDEFSTNLGNIKKGLSRSRENVVLREKAAEFSAEEIANSGKTKSAGKEKKRPQSLGDKLGEELE